MVYILIENIILLFWKRMKYINSIQRHSIIIFVHAFYARMKQKQFGELIVFVGVYWKGICQQCRSNTSNIILLRLFSFSSYCSCRWIQTDLLGKHRMTSSWLRRSLAFILFGMLFHMSTRQRLTFLSTYTTLVRAYHNQIFDFSPSPLDRVMCQQKK